MNRVVAHHFGYPTKPHKPSKLREGQEASLGFKNGSHNSKAQWSPLSWSEESSDMPCYPWNRNRNTCLLYSSEDQTLCVSSGAAYKWEQGASERGKEVNTEEDGSRVKANSRTQVI